MQVEIFVFPDNCWWKMIQSTRDIQIYFEDTVTQPNSPTTPADFLGDIQ
jgi:hypothetical protein